MKKLKKVNALSLGKILGTMYAILGFIVGASFTIFAIVGNTFFQSETDKFPMFVGLLAIVFVPILYGVMGFISGVFIGWFYNFAAKWVGPVEVEFYD